MKDKLELQLAILRDKNIPTFLVNIIDWIRYEFLL